MAGVDQSDLGLLVAAAEEAAALALTWFRHDPRTWPKGETSIVSEADIAVDQLLLGRLRAARPDYGWLSEETADTDERLSRARVFVVDPIDGTRAFLAGETEWTVSLAVVSAGRPVAAVLLAPALDQLFTAVAGQGATLNGKPLALAEPDPLAGIRLAGPKRFARIAAEALGAPVPPVRFVPSLAYRLALVAAGDIDVAIAGPDAKDWDIAAADLILREAGAALIDLSGNDQAFNAPATGHPALVAATPRLGAAVARRLAEWQQAREGSRT